MARQLGKVCLVGCTALHIDPALEWDTSESVRETLGGRWTGDYRVVPAPQFNRMVDEYGSKGTVLGRGLIDLLASLTAAVPDDGEPLAGVPLGCEHDVLQHRAEAGVAAEVVLLDAHPDEGVGREAVAHLDARARAAEIGFHPRIFAGENVGHRPDHDDLALVLHLHGHVAPGQ